MPRVYALGATKRTILVVWLPHNLYVDSFPWADLSRHSPADPIPPQAHSFWWLIRDCKSFSLTCQSAALQPTRSTMAQTRGQQAEDYSFSPGSSLVSSRGVTVEGNSLATTSAAAGNLPKVVATEMSSGNDARSKSIQRHSNLNGSIVGTEHACLHRHLYCGQQPGCARY